MAYRQLCAVTFAVLGLMAAGCGGGAGNGTAGSVGDEQPPNTAGDQAPRNGADDPTVNRDQPPSNAADATPGSTPGAGSGGGGAEGTCKAFCSQVGGADACKGNDPLSGLVRSACRADCRLDADDLKCEAQIVALLTCMQTVAGICTENGASETAVMACRDQLDSVDSCEDDGQMMNPPTDTCTMAQGCNCAADPCKTCQCTLGAQSATCMPICE